MPLKLLFGECTRPKVTYWLFHFILILNTRGLLHRRYSKHNLDDVLLRKAALGHFHHDSLKSPHLHLIKTQMFFWLQEKSVMREQEEEKEEEAAAALQTVCHIISNAPFQKYSKCLCTKGKLPFPELTLLWLMLPNILSKEKHLKKRKRRREPKKKK